MKVTTILTLCGLFSPIEIAAQEFNCEMRATPDNYYVYIRDPDRDGNSTRTVLSRGWCPGRTGRNRQRSAAAGVAA